MKTKNLEPSSVKEDPLGFRLMMKIKLLTPLTIQVEPASYVQFFDE